MQAYYESSMESAGGTTLEMHTEGAFDEQISDQSTGFLDDRERDGGNMWGNEFWGGCHVDS